MSEQKKDSKIEASRKSPPCTPMGFRIGNMNNEMLVVDMLDDGGGTGEFYVFSSIALTKGTAKRLYESLGRFVEKDE